MACVNPNDSNFKEILKKVKNPIRAELVFQQQIDEYNDLRNTMTDIVSGKLKNVTTDTTDYIYDLLSDKGLEILKNNGISKENFNSEFNKELSKSKFSKWLDSIIAEISRILGKEKLNNIIDSITKQDVQDYFTAEGDMLIYGITSDQKSKIPLINQLLYRTISPVTYNLKSILARGAYSLFVGRSYKDFISTIDFLRKMGVEMPTWASDISEEQYNKREDAWRLSNGLSQLHNTFKFVGKGFVDSNYNLIESDMGENVYAFVDPQFNDVDIDKQLGVDRTNFVMGNYAIKFGMDDTGHYFQYNDRWDLNITNKIAQKVIDVTQNPFIVTGKIYKALSYDETGTPIEYYTNDSNNPNIKEYNDMIEHINIQEAMNNNAIDELNNCFY